jgi:hypothetical protein
MAYSKAKLKSNGDKAPPVLQTIPNWKYDKQMLAYTDPAIGFTQTLVLELQVSWG